LGVNAFHDIEKYLTSGGGRKLCTKLYTESMLIQYLWNKIALCEILHISFDFKSICAFK
jgi:hypothetical protein